MKQVCLGFLGCGNIGGGVYRLLGEMQETLKERDNISISVKKILVKNIDEAVAINEKKGLCVPRELLTEHAEDVTGDPAISIVCEFMGGEQPAARFMQEALAHGKHVITANKVALALNWDKLQAQAEESHVGLWYEASVGGVIPVIRVLNVNLESDRIDRIYGIINGTTNYILTRMAQEGKDYDEVLRDAQRLGLAEPNPATDVEGMDAAYKLSILASLAFHGRVTYEQIYREGITQVSAQDIAFGREMGYTLKLLGIAKKDGDVVETRVHPTFLPRSHPLASVNGSFNAVFLKGHACQEMMLQGRGAGDMPTASAIVGDLLHAACDKLLALGDKRVHALGHALRRQLGHERQPEGQKGFICVLAVVRGEGHLFRTDLEHGMRGVFEVQRQRTRAGRARPLLPEEVVLPRCGVHNLDPASSCLHGLLLVSAAKPRH